MAAHKQDDADSMKLRGTLGTSRHHLATLNDCQAVIIVNQMHITVASLEIDKIICKSRTLTKPALDRAQIVLKHYHLSIKTLSGSALISREFSTSSIAPTIPMTGVGRILLPFVSL